MVIKWDEQTTQQYEAETDAALLSMDKAAIITHMEKWNLPKEVERVKAAPDRVFWAGVHKARAASTSLPEVERIRSRMWLRTHGLSLPGER